MILVKKITYFLARTELSGVRIADFGIWNFKKELKRISLTELTADTERGGMVEKKENMSLTELSEH